MTTFPFEVPFERVEENPDAYVLAVFSCRVQALIETACQLLAEGAPQVEAEQIHLSSRWPTEVHRLADFPAFGFT